LLVPKSRPMGALFAACALAFFPLIGSLKGG
jgi:hypothetical protein